MNNISNIQDCYGCGVCAAICPKKIISLKLNSDGFYHPFIYSESECVNCGLCLDVCSFSHNTLANDNSVHKCYAAWSNNSSIREQCSSGGLGFEIASTLVEQGYKVCAVRYNINKNIAEHYLANSKEALLDSIGSKYIQSYTVDAFQQINYKENNLVIGTPCQIDSFRRLIRKKRVENNFILIDFFCHGVPSMWLWKKYLERIENKVSDLTHVSWRNKRILKSVVSDDNSHRGNGNYEKVNWHDSYNIVIKGKRSYYNSRRSQGDLFYNFFLGNTCLGKACYANCKFKKSKSSADIRIGDLWGSTYKDNKDGVTSIISFTDRGDSILNNLNCTLVEHPFDVVSEGQLKANLIIPRIRKHVIAKLKNEKLSLDEIYCFCRIYNLPKTICSIPRRFINKFVRLLKK